MPHYLVSSLDLMKLNLATVTFDIDPSATDYAQLDLVGSSNAAGFAFDGQSQQIAVVNVSDSCSLITLVIFSH